MGTILYNILDEMKQLSSITQQLKEEHNSFVDQVEKLKKKNQDMQQLIDVGTEPITAFVQVAKDDLTSSDVLALLRARAAMAPMRSQQPPQPPQQPQRRVPNLSQSWEDICTPCVITDSTKPFMVFRPINLELSAKEMSQLFEQNRLGKSAKSKLRVDRIAVSESFCKLLNYPREHLLQTKNPRKIIRAKHKKHFYLKVAPHLLKPSNTHVSPILAFEPRFMTKEGTILFTSSRMQIFYRDDGAVSFFIVCIETITKTHVPRYLEVKQKQRNKMAKTVNNTCPPLSIPIRNNNKMGGGCKNRAREDEVYRVDDNFELSPEDEAFLDGATYPYFLPSTKVGPAVTSDNFASPVGSPAGPSSFTPPASPVVGGCISVGTLDSFSEDYSWLLSEHNAGEPLSL